MMQYNWLSPMQPFVLRKVTSDKPEQIEEYSSAFWGVHLQRQSEPVHVGAVILWQRR